MFSLQMISLIFGPELARGFGQLLKLAIKKL